MVHCCVSLKDLKLIFPIDDHLFHNDSLLGRISKEIMDSLIGKISGRGNGRGNESRTQGEQYLLQC